MSNEKVIWDFFTAKGFSPAGVAGLMGNLYAESGLSPINLQNTYEKRLGFTDAEYVKAVDNGTYSNFVKDQAGFGLAQWTYWSRKQNLLLYAHNQKKSIGNLDLQLEFLYKELSGYYRTIFNTLKTTTSVRQASDSVLLNFERPADQSEAAKVKRASFGQSYYDRYAVNNTKEVSIMTEQQVRQTLVNAAISFLGYKESDGTHKKIVDLYNAHKPLAVGYKVTYTDAWCATFASAAAIKAGLTDIIPTECGCDRFINLFKSKGIWQENDAYVPSPGDYIFYDWQDSGVGDNVGSADHVGIVVSVSDNTMKIIEGNISNSVAYRNLAVNGKFIRGYGVPKYSSKANGTTAPVTTSTPAPTATKRDLKYATPIMTGDDVKALQERLIALGYDLGSDGADGKFGPKTNTALVSFQTRAKTMGLGVCDANTRKTLNL